MSHTIHACLVLHSEKTSMRDAILLSAAILVFTSSLADAAPIGRIVDLPSDHSLAEKATCRCALGLNCICRPYWAPAWGWRAPGWAAGVPVLARPKKCRQVIPKNGLEGEPGKDALRPNRATHLERNQL